MALIDELKYKLNSVEQRIGEKHTQIREIGSILEVEEAYRNDLDRAIAALTPQDAPDTAAVAEPEIPEGFMGWLGGSFDDFCAVQTVYTTTKVQVVLRTGFETSGLASGFYWEHSETHTHPNDIVAYRIIEASPVDQSETTASEPDPVLRAFEDDQIIAPAPAWIDEQTCEPVNPHVEVEGYAPVVAADEPEPKPSLLDRFHPFRMKADA